MSAGNPEDHYVIERLREHFAEDPRAGELGVEVSIVSGIVYLHGEVGSVQRRDALTVIVHELCPELEVRNEVAVTEVGPARAGPELVG